MSLKRKILTPKKGGKITMTDARNAVKSVKTKNDCKFIRETDNYGPSWKCDVCGKYVFYSVEEPTECVRDNDKFVSLRSGENKPQWIIAETISARPDGEMGSQSCCDSCKDEWEGKLDETWKWEQLK